MSLKASTAWRVITDPGAVRLLTRLGSRQQLQPFLLHSLSVKEFSERFELSLNAGHYRIKTFERAGLIAVQHLEGRRGRAIKHYIATANGFFVPFNQTRTESLERFMNESTAPVFAQFMRLLAHAGAELVRDTKELGFRLYNAGGYVNADFSPRGQEFDLLQALLAPDAPALMSSFTPLRLTHERAKALQLEMMSLLERYGSQNGPDTYQMHVGLTPGNYDM
jgi:hypothetical protein